MTTLQFTIDSPPHSRWTSLAVVLLLIACGTIFSGDGYLATSDKPLSEGVSNDDVALNDFDRVALALVGNSSFWPASPTSISADPYLQVLLSHAPKDVARNRLRDNLVLFVRAGVTDGRRWLAFACVSFTGLEVFTFERDNSQAAAYDRLIETRQFWSYYRNERALKIDVIDVQMSRDDVTTIIDVDGGRNIIQWKIGATDDPKKHRPMIHASYLVDSFARPRTGWLDDNNWWWPHLGQFGRHEGPSPSKIVPAIPEPNAITFIGDGRIGLASPQELALVDLNSGAKVAHPMPKVRNENSRTMAFSPTGKWCFDDGRNFSDGPSFIVDSLTGAVREIVKVGHAASLCFLDEDTLITFDSNSFRKIHCATGREEPLPQPAEYVPKLTMTEELTALAPVQAFRDVRVIDGQGHVKATFKGIQGLHQMSFSPGGRHLVLKGQSGFSVLDVDKNRTLLEHDLDRDLHTARSRVKWSADGLRGATAGSRYVYVWTLSEPRSLVRFPHGCTGYWPDVALSADGRRMVASAAGSSTIAYWPDLNASIRQAE